LEIRCVRMRNLKWLWSLFIWEQRIEPRTVKISCSQKPGKKHIPFYRNEKKLTSQLIGHERCLNLQWISQV
jgi:hypothetical protein